MRKKETDIDRLRKEVAALNVIRAVAKWYGIYPGRLFTNNGPFLLREARNLCYYFLVRMHKYAFSDTAEFMYKKGTGAIHHGVKMIEGLISMEDERILAMLEEVKRELNYKPGPGGH